MIHEGICEDGGILRFALLKYRCAERRQGEDDGCRMGLSRPAGAFARLAEREQFEWERPIVERRISRRTM
jgi:hypothetical protein